MKVTVMIEHEDKRYARAVEVAGPADLDAPPIDPDKVLSALFGAAHVRARSLLQGVDLEEVL